MRRREHFGLLIIDHVPGTENDIRLGELLENAIYGGKAHERDAYKIGEHA